MQASQAINLAPQTQNAAAKPVRYGARDTKAGKFDDFMNQETTAMPHEGAKTQGNAENKPPVQTDTSETPQNTEIPPQNAPEPETNIIPEETGNLIPFPITIAFDPASQEINPADTAQQLMEQIAAILEGNQGKILNMKEIAPLLQELAQVLQEMPPQTGAMEKLLPKLELLLEEVQARMPLNEEIADTAQKLPAIDKLNQIFGQLRGNPSPLENVSEKTEIKAQASPQEAAAPLFRQVAAEAFKAATTTPDKDTQQQPQREAKATPVTTANQEPFRVDMAPQRVFFADAQAAAGASGPRFVPMTPQTLFDTMVQRIVALPGADPHMEIALKPDHLGKVTVDLSMGEQGLTAKIIASDEGVRNMLAAHVNRLSETLAEKGIRVENVEIIYSGLADKQSDGQQSNRQEQGNKGNSLRPALWGVAENPAIGWDNAYLSSPYTDEWGTSSVEYQA